MKTITLTVDLDDNSLRREYEYDPLITEDTWGARVADMIDTIEKSKSVTF